jgi:hypothetical protein
MRLTAKSRREAIFGEMPADPRIPKCRCPWCMSGTCGWGDALARADADECAVRRKDRRLMDVLMMLGMHMRVRRIHQFTPMDIVVNFSQMQPDTAQLHSRQ